MAEETPNWNLTEREWAALIQRVQKENDVLEDGALVRVAEDLELETVDLKFYATALNKPQDWRYPFLEEISQSTRQGAMIGHCWHDARSGYVEFEVTLAAAAQAISADYESGVDDLDYVSYLQAVEQAVKGSPADLQWLAGEFARLIRIVNG